MWRLLADTAPSLGDVRALGLLAFALMVGAAAVYRWGVEPERRRADRLEAQLERANAAMQEWRASLDAAVRALDRRNTPRSR
ncbi:MAG TPA: hypothetical protein VFJ85_02800 [Acidimicrobiales bacterium]|nr:hypothetical protein [Acidimicrobiales bacterium]